MQPRTDGEKGYADTLLFVILQLIWRNDRWWLVRTAITWPLSGFVVHSELTRCICIFEDAREFFAHRNDRTKLPLQNYKRSIMSFFSSTNNAKDVDMEATESTYLVVGDEETGMRKPSKGMCPKMGPPHTHAHRSNRASFCV